MESIWTATCEIPRYPPLKGDLRTDVLVIGGGMAGILCAHILQKAGIDYALVEASRLGCGITKNTTAKITSQHGLIYQKIFSRFGMERTHKYMDINQAALEEYRKLCKHIDCDFQEQDNFIYSLNDRKKLDDELSLLNQLGFPAELAENLPLPVPTAGAVKFRKQAQFHPLKFLAHLADGMHIYENTAVRELTPDSAITDQGTIRFQKVIVATHFPFINKHGSYFLKMYQQRSYVLALEGAPKIDGMYLDEAENGLSFRSYNGTLLLGGGGHRTGKTGGGWHELETFARTHYPEAKITHRWATQDCMTLDGIPYIGHYSKRTPNMYVATGFNKWGMTSSMAAALVLADLVQDRPNPYADLFSPSRSMLTPQLGINALEATVNLLSLNQKRCPHLGCALKWNPQEHSWDCPCHGSRFEEDGTLIDNPAAGNLKRP